MKLYFIIPACLLLASVSSCKRDFDCHCTTRGTRTEYVENIRAENKDDADKKCAEYMGNINEVSLPGIDCEIEQED